MLLKTAWKEPSLWFVVKAPRLDKQAVAHLPEDSDRPDIAVFGGHQHVADFLVYVDDVLAAGPHSALQPLLSQIPTTVGRQLA